MFKTKEIKILWPFYGQSLLLSISKVLMPFYILYFFDIGVSLAVIALIGSLRSVVGFVFEIPTGVIADKFGRRISVMIGYFGKAITLFLIPFTSNIYLIGALLLFDAFFQTFFSGAETALVVDYVKEKSPDLLDKFFLRDGMIFNFGLIFAPILGAFVVHMRGMSYLRFFVSVSTFLATLFLFKIKEPKIFHDDDEIREHEGDASQFSIKTLFSHSKRSFIYLSKKPILMFLFGGLALYRFIEEISGLAWTPYLTQIGVTPEKIGYIYSIIGGLGLISPLLVEKLLKYFSKEKIIVRGLAILGVAVLVVGIVSLPRLVVSIFILSTQIESIYLPLEQSLSQSYIPSSMRATISSIKSMVENVSGIIAGPLAGVLLGIISLQQGIMLSGFLVCILALIYFFIFRKKEEKPSLPSTSQKLANTHH